MERETVSNRDWAMATIRVADFTTSPGGRETTDGAYSGEWFRDEILFPALKRAMSEHDVLTVELDGTAGYGASFLDEAFAGLIRSCKIEPGEIKKHLKVVARTDLFRPYERLVARYMQKAST